MIYHVVMWKLAGDDVATRQAHAEVYKAALEALAGKIPGMREIRVGYDLDNVENSADVVLISTHDDQAALDAYQVHPLHLAVKDKLKGRSIERRMVDYKV